MKWEIGDRLRVLDAQKINGGHVLVDGGIYHVGFVFSDGTLLIDALVDTGLYLAESEMQYVERVYESSDTELGEPSAECNCATLTEIVEELTDIKAMIGRLLKRGETE